jgi:hypothetical protein
MQGFRNNNPRLCFHCNSPQLLTSWIDVLKFPCDFAYGLYFPELWIISVKLTLSMWTIFYHMVWRITMKTKSWIVISEPLHCYYIYVFWFLLIGISNWFILSFNYLIKNALFCLLRFEAVSKITGKLQDINSGS